MYEHRTVPPLSKQAFRWRVLGHLAVAVGIVAVALGVGILGYHTFGELNWIDATQNASMILGGMGPVSEIRTNAGKLFASGYALFSGLLFIALMGLLLAPFAHRIMHKLHWEDEPKD